MPARFLDSTSILRVPEVKEAESNAEILVAVACSRRLACLSIIRWIQGKRVERVGRVEWVEWIER